MKIKITKRQLKLLLNNLHWINCGFRAVVLLKHPPSYIPKDVRKIIKEKKLIIGTDERQFMEEDKQGFIDFIKLF